MYINAQRSTLQRRKEKRRTKRRSRSSAAKEPLILKLFQEPERGLAKQGVPMLGIALPQRNTFLV